MISGSLEFLVDKEEYDNKSMYIYEFNDTTDESLKKRFGVLGNEDYWYPFINDPKEVQLFETKFQKLAAQRQGSFYYLLPSYLHI